MRKVKILDALLPGLRQRILAATLLSPGKSWYLSELAVRLATSPSSLQRELEALVGSGILQRRADGRRRYYRADTTSPVFKELHSLFEKTVGIVPLLKRQFAHCDGKIKWAAIYGSLARGEERGSSDIDLLVVGDVGMKELLPSLRRAEKQCGREVHVTRYSESEFAVKKRVRDHFLNRILKSKLLTVAGSRNELEKAAN